MAEEQIAVADRRLTLVRTFFQHYFENRTEEAVALLEPTVEYVAPQRQGSTRTFVGVAAVAGHLEQFLASIDHHVDVLKWEDWLLGGEHVAGLVRVTLQRPGRIHEFRLVFIVTVSLANRISRVECYWSDPEAYERFFAG